MDAIPLDLKKAIAIGIGLFIAFIGLVNSGVVVKGEGTPCDSRQADHVADLRHVLRPVLTIVLRARGVRGDLLIGIVVTTILATIINEAAGNDAGFTAGAQLAERRLRDTRPGAARELQLRRVHRARIHLGRRLGVLALPRRLLRHDGHARRRRQAGRATSTRKGGCRRSASRCSSTRSPRSPVARRRPRRRRPTSSRRPGWRRGADGLGRSRLRRALLPVHVLRADHRHGAAAGNGACTDHRRLPDDVGPDRGGGAEPRRATRGRKLAGIDFSDLGSALRRRSRS